jgi:hypothetical protein
MKSFVFILVNFSSHFISLYIHVKFTFSISYFPYFILTLGLSVQKKLIFKMQNENFPYGLNSFKKWLSMHRERERNELEMSLEGSHKKHSKLTRVFLSLIEAQTKNFLEKNKERVSERAREREREVSERGMNKIK